MKRLDNAQDEMERLIADVRGGKIGASEGDVIARAGYAIIKGEEVRLNHRIAEARGELKAFERA